MVSKLESEWIKNLKYSDDEQLKEWRTYGEEGVQVLIRGMERANRPTERAYRQFSRQMPYWVSRWLPATKLDATRSTRMTIASLLSSLGSDAKSATPIMVRMLNDDEDDSVRQIVITFFTYTEDAKCPLNQMPAKEKRALLPAFLRSMQISQLRNNAAIALRFYPEESKIVAPVLVKALQDSDPAVRLLAAEALGAVAPSAAKQADTLSVVIEIAKLPDDQIVSRAVAALGDFPDAPEPAVRALIEALVSTNTLVACQSVWSLQSAPKEYKQFSGSIIPALQKAAERKDNVRGYARSALTQWISGSYAKQGAK